MKTCFIISPIGLPNSPIREHADLWIEQIAGPALEQYKIEYVRSDNDQYIGGVADRIFNHLENDDLVVADLTEKNANVYLEVGYRMACKKPLVLMLEVGNELPFDVRHLRVIPYDLNKPVSARVSLKKTIDDVLKKDVKPTEGVTELTENRIFAGTVPPEEADLPDDCRIYIQY